MPRPPSPSYTTLGPSASQVGSPPGVLALQDVKTEPPQRGSLLHTIQYEGSGGWVQAPLGRVWCSARHAGAKVIDLKKVCFAALIPPDMDKMVFCSSKRGWKHSMPGGYSVAYSFEKALPDSDLVSKRARDEGGARGGRGRGGGGYNLKYEPSHDTSWSGKGSWAAKGAYGGKGGWGGKGEGGGKGGGKGQWGGNGDWGGKGDWNAGGNWNAGGKGDWSAGGGWAASGGWQPAEKGKGRGGKGSYGRGGWN